MQRCDRGNLAIGLGRRPCVPYDDSNADVPGGPHTAPARDTILFRGQQHRLLIGHEPRMNSELLASV
jgi:hypothetical protein